MNKIVRAAATGLLLSSATALAQQDQGGLAFATAIDLNYKQLDMVVVGGGLGLATFKPKLWTININPSLAYRDFYAALSVERTLGAGNEFVTTGSGSTLTVLDSRFTREENSITAGYRLGEFSLFLGYLVNATDRFTSTQLVEYGERGPYAGIGYAHRFGNRGSLSASVAQAKLRGTFDNNASGAISASKGDIAGQSYSLTWSAPLTGSLFYRVGYKATRYDFEFTLNGVDRNTKQDYDAFVMGVVHYF